MAASATSRPAVARQADISIHPDIRPGRGPASFKAMLTRIGAHLSENTISALNGLLNYLEVGRWLRAHGFSPTQRYATREELFDLVGHKIANQKVLYLEFGVFEGVATRYWANLLKHPECQLFGFDSFEGLPEKWTHARKAGDFDVQGRLPVIHDSRVRFVKGWFSDTVSAFQAPPHEVLMVNMDADLYSSTDYVLRQIEALIVPGSYLYFDEFHDRAHELRAFEELLERTGWNFRLIGSSRALNHVMFQRL